ncbi:unnamed protein product [Cylindrotheca closterium]|uniref:SET domain-containing protein n=1 Tax=Cylindrotheca closterium TaxID=2856 RepID=A0AAD2FXD5_9STRA|nr:unnamed protein product [Cylindrotheca closterium]
MPNKLIGFLAQLGALLSAEQEPIGPDYARQDETVKELVDWSTSKGGFFHPHVQIRRWNLSDPTSYFGAFLNGPVKKDDLLMRIPGDIKLQLHTDFWTNSSIVDEVVCELAWLLKHEYDNGTKSIYKPYIDYIKTQSKHQIPVMWSTKGKKLLEKVQVDIDLRDLNADEDSGSHFHNWIDQWYGSEDCLYDTETDQELEKWFLAMAQQRGYDYALIPIYDMLNHDPGNVNTITRPSIYDTNGFGVYALRDMEAGEELLYDYYDCPDCKRCETCGSSSSYWGTPEMLRDFGFVEAHPHKYHFYEGELSVTLIIDKDRDDGSYKVSCTNKCPSTKEIERHYNKLLPLLEKDILPLSETLPSDEYFMIKMYYDTLVTDFKQYLDHPESAIVTRVKYDTPPDKTTFEATTTVRTSTAGKGADL